MKLPSFLIKAWASVRSIFTSSDKSIQNSIKVAVLAVEWLKTATDSQLADFATMAIPGTWDDKLLATLRKVLPKVLSELNILATDLQTTEGDVKSAYTGAVAVNTARELTEFKVSYGDTKMLVENAYKVEVKGVK